MQNKNVEYLCTMKSTFKSVFALILLVHISACTIDKARPSKKQHLYVASDCLTRKDEKLFRNFEKSNKINIHIVSFTSDSLRILLKQEGLTTNIDCVISSSVYDMKNLSDSKFLQEQSINLEKGMLPSKYISERRDFIGFGIDPYILLAQNDSITKWRNYSDLNGKLTFTTDLTSKSDLLPFYSVVLAKLEKSKPKFIYSWYENFSKKKVNASNDSLKLNGTKVIFTLYSHYEKNKSDNKDLKKLQLIFPNQRKAGSYFNMPCFGIIKQARNYGNAKLFLNYLLLDNVNKRLTNRLKMFPVIVEKQSVYLYQNQRYKKTSVSPIKQSKQYPRVSSLMKNI